MLGKALIAITAIIGISALASSAQAANVGVPGIGASVAAAVGTDIVPVHGYHKRCRWGPRHGWYHRHRYSGRPRACTPRHLRRKYHRRHKHKRYYDYDHDLGHYYRKKRKKKYYSTGRARLPENCVRDWHCKNKGPFGLKKVCGYRTLCY